LSQTKLVVQHFLMTLTEMTLWLFILAGIYKLSPNAFSTSFISYQGLDCEETVLNYIPHWKNWIFKCHNKKIWADRSFTQCSTDHIKFVDYANEPSSNWSQMKDTVSSFHGIALFPPLPSLPFWCSHYAKLWIWHEENSHIITCVITSVSDNELKKMSHSTLWETCLMVGLWGQWMKTLV
jgi:hypothetical protein